MLELREFCGSLKDNKSIKCSLLSESEWDAVVELKDVLLPFKKYTTKLQAEQCTLSDFYGYWKLIRMKMEKSSHVLKNNILNNMNQREQVLLLNPVILGAVYLDARYQRTLQPEQKKTAKLYLSNIFHKIQIAQKNELSSQQPNDDSNIINEKSDSFDELTKYLYNTGNPDSQTSVENSLEEIINEFDGVHESTNIPVLEYWEKNKQKFPKLYPVSQVVLAIPATQTSVERAFSSLPIVITPRRTRLGDNSLENILLVRTNKNELIDFQNGDKNM